MDKEILGQDFSVAQEILSGLISSVPNILKALVVFIIGYIIAKIVGKVVKTILEKSGIDKLKDKLEEIDFIGNANVKVMPSGVIASIIYYFILLTVTVISVDILQITAITELLQELMILLPKLLVAALVLIVGVLIAEAVRKIVQSTCESLGIPAAKVIATFVFFFVMINALMIALNKATIPTEFLTDNLTVLFAGIVFAFAIGYGLASKGIMSSFLSSYYSKSRFNIGDVVTIDGARGEIVDIDSTSLVIHGEGYKVIVPLSKLSEEKVIIHEVKS